MSNFVKVNEDYGAGRVLGSGMQGEVRAGIHYPTENTEIALKFVDKTVLDQKSLRMLDREVTIMKSLNHPNITNLHDYYSNVTFNGKNCCLLVLELASAGELFEFLMHSGYFEENLSRTYMRQLLSALTACHQNGIYHRDIKPENILLGSRYQLKLADFGLANIADQNTLLETECGTKSYMAPEIIAHKPYNGAEVDIWSAGVVLFIMMCGSPPFEVAARSDWWFNAISLNRYDRFWAAHLRGAGHMAHHQKAQQFVEKLLRADPSQRLTMEQIESEEWIHQEWLNESQLFTEMESRRQKVLNAKRQEMMEAMRKREQRGGNAVRRDRVDVFAQDTHRGTGVVSTYDQFLDATAGRQLNVLFSYANAEETLMRLTKEFLTIDENARVVSSPETCNISAQLRMAPARIEVADEVIEVPGASLSVSVNLFQGSGGDGVLIVDLERKAGDLIAFQKMYKLLNANFQPPAVEQHEEDPLDEDIGML